MQTREEVLQAIEDIIGGYTPWASDPEPFKEKLFSLFLDMAESMILESKTLHGNFHTYTCDHIDEESEIKHPIQVTHQCFVVDQLKEKIAKLRGGENNE